MSNSNVSPCFPGTGNPSGSSTTIEQGLLALGLPQYIEPCRSSGLTSWATLSQLSESDFESLGISIGHRRKLQRAFAQQNFWPDYLPLPTPDDIKGFRSFPFEAEPSSSGSDESITLQPSSAGISSQPTSAGGPSRDNIKQLNEDAQPGLELRQRVSSWVDSR